MRLHAYKPKWPYTADGVASFAYYMGIYHGCHFTRAPGRWWWFRA